MENKLNKKYGLIMAICMVIGIVIGSGVFFKAQEILIHTGGSVWLGVLSFLIGGIVMVVCALTFAKFASKYEKVNGIVDYSEFIVGKKYAYLVGWFTSIIYFPAMTSILAWVSSRYTLVLFGVNDVSGGLCMILAGLYLIAMYALNSLSPKLAGKFHVSATVIKLIPLFVMIVVGSIFGLVNGNITSSFALAPSNNIGFDAVFSGIVASAFAYEGWIIATTINAELKDAKKNLPIALTFGTIVIVFIYILYFISLTGAASVDTLITEGSPKAFVNIFGNLGGTVFNAFIVISCLGTLNGLMIASTRGLYSLAIRNKGPNPKMFSQVDKVSNAPTNSGIIALLVCALWLFYFFGANLYEKPLFGVFSFDSSELPIITTYLVYLPIFITYVVKEIKNKQYKSIILPILATICSIFMIFAAFYAHGIKPYINARENGEFSFPILFYFIIFLVIMFIGYLFDKLSKKSDDIRE